MYSPQNINVPLNITTGQQQRASKYPNKEKGLPIQKFWEKLRVTANIETIMLVVPSTPEEYPTSIIDGKKKPWGEYYKQKTQKKEGDKTLYPAIICTSGNDPYNQQECVGCYLEEHTTTKPNPHKKSLTTEHQIIHFAFYHKVPRLDDEGNHRSFDDKLLYNDYRCEGEGCKHCKAKVDKVFGKLFKLELGANHTKNLLGGKGWDSAAKKEKFYRGIRQQLNWTCGGCGGQIVAKYALCGGCGTVLEDFTKLQGDDPKDMLGSLRAKIELKLQLPTSCTHCNNWTGFPDEAADCCYDVEGKMKLKKLKCGFDAPQRMDLYSSVIQINKEGAQTESAIKLKGAFSIDEKSNNPYQFEVDEPLGTIVNRAIDINGGLFDLDKDVCELLLSPEFQARILGVPNPYAGGSRLPGEDTEVVQQVPKFVAGKGVVIK